MRQLQQFEEKHQRICNILFLLILALGLYLRIYQYLMGRSLWEDEAHLALNFATRDFAGILRPLDYIQAGPVLYLLTTKAFTAMFGNGACALRALPFLASLLTLPLFYYIIRSLTGSRIAALTGFLIFSVNIAVIYYSSEIKTYGLDVAVYLLLIYLVVSKYKFVTRHRDLLLGLAGCISILYSNITFILLFCIALYLLAGWYKNRRINHSELKVLAAWAVVFLANYFLFIYHHPYAKIQQENYTFAFPPGPLFSNAFNQFMLNSLDEIGFRLLLYVSPAYGFKYVLLLLLLVATGYAVYKKQYKILLFTIGPVLIHFTLSFFKVYPFWYRLILYFCPPLMLLMVWGMIIIAGMLTRRVHLIAGLAFVIYTGYFFTEPSFRQYPLWFREVKPSLDYINKNYPQAQIFVTTPYTLYKYYNLTGYATNSRYEAVEWNIKPEKYYSMVENATKNYLLFHAEDPAVDGYKEVIDDLKRRHLIVKQFSYMTYTVSEIMPLHPDTSLLNIDHSYFAPDKLFDLDSRKVVAIWTGDIVSKPVLLQKGQYKMSIISKGTPAKGVFPHLHVFINDHQVTEYNTPGNYQSTDIAYEQKEDGAAVFKIVMDNDLEDKAKKEDRNAFIYLIRIKKITP